MTIENARKELPIWASAEKINMEFETKAAERREFPWGLRMTMRQEWFMKRYGPALMFILMFAVYSILLCVVTGSIVRHNTEAEVTERVTAQLRGEFQEYLTQQEQERMAAGLLTGEASFEAAAEELAGPMAQVIATYAQDYGIGEEGLKTIGWVFCARHAQHSSEFGRTPQEILEKSSAWEGKVVGHAVRNQDKEIAREIAREYLSGNYPDNFTTAITFFNREPGGKIIARNELFAGPYTVYWYYGK